MKRTILMLALSVSSLSVYGQPFIYGVNWDEGLVRIDAASAERTVLFAAFPEAMLNSIALSPLSSELIVGTETGTIFRSDMEITRRDTILTEASWESLHPDWSSCGHHALAVDTSEQKIYAMGHGWCAGHFISMNLDGSDLEFGDGGGNHLAIHPETRRAYFSLWFWNESYIISTELDGSDPDTLITENNFTGGESDDIGGAVFDFEAGVMYWQNEGWIKRANLDGSGENKITEFEANMWSGMYLDPEYGHLYFSEGEVSSPLWRVNLDGSGKTLVSQGGVRDMVIVKSTMTSLTARVDVPVVLPLMWNYPNPFHSGTRISYQLPRQSRIQLTVYDMLGREIAVLDRGVKSAGHHEVSFDAKQLPSGRYLYRLETGSSVTEGMIMLKQ